MTNNREKQSIPLDFGDIPRQLNKLSSLRGNYDIEARKAKLRKAAEGFEAIFVRQMLKSMRSTLTSGGMFGSGSVGEIYSDMMDNAISEKIAERGDMGLADIIYKQMVKSIESENEPCIVKNNENIIKGRIEK
ncbi:rod-binding protein [Candidatus Latescibacterota bacterium]